MREYEPYAAVPYVGGTYPQTHPDNLATIGHILGMKAADPARARVLEVGCADGANLLGMATWLPEARFVGVDGEPGQIARGEALRDAAGLHNVTLHTADLRALSPERLGGTFDYIIAHGVFSWIAPDAQAALLRLCRAALRPQGIAYISYNALPGWHAGAVVRDLMRFHTRHLVAAGAPPDTIMDAALAVVGFAAPHSVLYTEYAQYLSSLDRDYFFHDYLSAHNQPLSLSGFLARCAPAGLQYLGDAEPHRSLGLTLPPETQGGLDVLTDDPVAREQYIDVLTNRELRRSLLCHAEVPLRREAGAHVLAGLSARSALVPAERRQRWQLPGDPATAVVAQTPGQQRILKQLREAWPAAVPVEGDEMAELVWACFLRGLMSVHRWAPPLLAPATVQPGMRPTVPALVQAQLARGLPLTSAWLQGSALSRGHGRLDALARRLDGSGALAPDDLPAARALAALGVLLAAPAA